MISRDTEQILADFKTLNFHDGFMKKMQINPPQYMNKKRYENTLCSQYSILFDLILHEPNFDEPWEPYNIVLEFVNVANLNMSVDFDIFSDNAPHQIWNAKIFHFKDLNNDVVIDGYKDWNVTYNDQEEGDISNTPVEYKLNNKSQYFLFQIELFGGSIKILAQDFVIKKRKLLNF
ncbi:hypothetical protein [Anaerophilus nitritogenes]|uniref:hypothetical protein n=1 Tax=Anaerophilus nitritogenes TaxID=2498136 RepID=UPI00101CA1BE|nr:hypothetical protein [Anaerophilus nitritogenes]